VVLGVPYDHRTDVERLRDAPFGDALHRVVGAFGVDRGPQPTEDVLDRILLEPGDPIHAFERRHHLDALLERR